MHQFGIAGGKNEGGGIDAFLDGAVDAERPVAGMGTVAFGYSHLNDVIDLFLRQLFEPLVVYL